LRQKQFSFFILTTWLKKTMVGIPLGKWVFKTLFPIDLSIGLYSDTIKSVFDGASPFTRRLPLPFSGNDALLIGLVIRSSQRSEVSSLILTWRLLKSALKNANLILGLELRL